MGGGASALRGGGARTLVGEDLALLDDSHQRLIETLARIKVARLQDRHAGSRFVLGEHVAGLALHHRYPASQVALVRRLADADVR